MTDTRKFKAPYKRLYDSNKHFDHFKTFGTPKRRLLGAAPLPSFPTSLLAPNYVNVQTANNCTAYAAVKERFAVTGKRYDPEAQWKLELQLLNVPDMPQGVTLDAKMQTGIKLGFVPEGETAPTDKAQNYFWVKRVAGLDWFDSVRLALYQLYQKYGYVVPVTLGLNWYADWDHTLNGFVPDVTTSLLGGHDIEIAGFEEFIPGTPNVFLSGSWGPAYGDQGNFRMTREIFNKYATGYGAAYWTDDTTLEVQHMNLFVAILKNVVILLQNLVAHQTGYPPAPTLLWDTPQDARHSVRVICDDMGMPLVPSFPVDGKQYLMKDVLCACLQQESGFMNWKLDGSPMRHANLDKAGNVSSTDWGICQINDYWHIGPGKDFPSIDYVIANPEVCVRWMAKMFLTGKASQWSSYTSGAFKKYLPS